MNVMATSLQQYDWPTELTSLADAQRADVSGCDHRLERGRLQSL